MMPEVTNTVTALENCICLLFPTPEDFFIQDRNEVETDTTDCDKKTGPTNYFITKETEDIENTKAYGLDQKDRLNKNDKKLEQNRNTVKNECDTPSTSRPQDVDVEEENSDFGSETSDSEEDIDFRAYGMPSSKYSIEVNVNTGICH
jgi:hypothetical protein